ncbi:MAG: MerR family transcriptional regulator [Acidimicrobiales bacterium]|nr:MerR family transcriptional regulator [Acidimicrobiales bacterium]
MALPEPGPTGGLPFGGLPFDDEHAPLYSVGQVAGMLGVQSAFVRRLDREEVVQPARSAGGQRRYSRHEVGQVQAVSRMAGEGMSLAGIRRILVLEAEVAALDAEVAALRQMLGETTSAVR